MRITVEVDGELLAEAQRIAGTSTASETVDYALRAVVLRERRRAVLTLRGQIDWQGDLDKSRAGRPLGPGTAADGLEIGAD